jgi:hypothetical protein
VFHRFAGCAASNCRVTVDVLHGSYCIFSFVTHLQRMCIHVVESEVHLPQL